MLINCDKLTKILAVLIATFGISSCAELGLDFGSIDGYYTDEYDEAYDSENYQDENNLYTEDYQETDEFYNNFASYDEKMEGMGQFTPRGIVERMDATGNYDLVGDFRPISEAEVRRSLAKWADGVCQIVKKDYKGHTVEIRKALNGSELKEMRLRFIPHPNGRPFNKRVVEILNEIADAETIRTCGLNAKPLIIYNKPSFEAYQPTSFYRPEVRRSSYIREYAYRCLY